MASDDQWDNEFREALLSLCVHLEDLVHLQHSLSKQGAAIWRAGFEAVTEIGSKVEIQLFGTPIP